MSTSSPPSTVSLQPAERRAVAVIAGVAVLRMLGLFMLLPVLAIWAAGFSHATPLLIGLAVSGYGLTQTVLQIPFGALSDRIGRRPVVVGGLCLFIIGSVVAAIADNIYVLILGRLLQGAGAVSAALTAWLADATRAEARIRATAVLGASIGGAFVLSLLAGPLLAGWFSIPKLFFVSAGMGLLAIALLGLLPRSGVAHRLRGSQVGLVELLGDSLLRSHYLAVFVLHVLLTALFVSLPFVLRDGLGVAPADHWKLYLSALLLSLLLVLPMLRRTERSRRESLAIVAWGLIAVGLAVLSLTHYSWALALLGASLFFAGFNFLEASLPAWVSLAAPEAGRGSAMGMYASSQFFGAFCGGVLGGGLLVVDGWPERMLVLALLAAVMVPATVILRASVRAPATGR